MKILHMVWAAAVLCMGVHAAESATGEGAAALPAAAPPTTSAAAEGTLNQAQLLHACADGAWWRGHFQVPEVNRETVTQAAEAIRQSLQRQQAPAGLFPVEYNVAQQRQVERVEPVSQAYALWALTRYNRLRPDPASVAAIQRGFRFFYGAMTPQPSLSGQAFAPVFPGDGALRTATSAGLALAIMEYLETPDNGLAAETRPMYEAWLTQCLDWLDLMGKPDGLWCVAYFPLTEERNDLPDPFTDALCLLANSRAAQAFKRDATREALPARRTVAIDRYVAAVWSGKEQAQLLRQFAPVASLGFASVATTPADPWRETAGDATLGLAWWMQVVVDAPRREVRLAESALPLAVAAQIARQRQDEDAAKRLLTATDEVIARLLPFQVRGPFWFRNPLVHGMKVPTQLDGAMLTQPDFNRVRLDDTASTLLLFTERLRLEQ